MHNGCFWLLPARLVLLKILLLHGRILLARDVFSIHKHSKFRQLVVAYFQPKMKLVVSWLISFLCSHLSHSLPAEFSITLHLVASSLLKQNLRKLQLLYLLHHRCWPDLCRKLWFTLPLKTGSCLENCVWFLVTYGPRLLGGKPQTVGVWYC